MFKRLVSVLTVSALLFSVMSLGFTATASYEEDVLYGDVDGIKNDDGEFDVDTEDARLALKLAAGTVLLEDEEQLKRTDVNFDGVITIADARLILRGVAGLASLQPSGAFKGFDDGGIFKNEEGLVLYFNAVLNRIKVATDDSQYIAATITKTESDQLSKDDLKIQKIQILSLATDAEGVTSMVRERLTEDDKENTQTVIPFGSDDFSSVSVEGEDYVSALTVSDVFGARASYDETAGEITIEIALPDTDMESATQSAYGKVFNVSDMMAEQNTTLIRLMGASSGEGAMFREFKNCVLKVVVGDADGDGQINDVLSYTVTYESKVYVAQVKFFSLAQLTGVEFKKVHSIKYEDFQWPPVQ